VINVNASLGFTIWILTSSNFKYKLKNLNANKNILSRISDRWEQIVTKMLFSKTSFDFWNVFENAKQSFLIWIWMDSLMCHRRVCVCHLKCNVLLLQHLADEWQPYFAFVYSILKMYQFFNPLLSKLIKNFRIELSSQCKKRINQWSSTF